MGIKSTCIALYEGVRQVLFPLRCPVCDRIVKPYGEKICLECMDKLKPVSAPWCRVCGKGLRETKELCEECASGNVHMFQRCRSLYDYRSVAKSIYRFKYGGRREYGEFYGEEMARCLGEYIRGISPDAIIPIPLHEKRYRSRGYNQAAVLARVIGGQMGLPVFENHLIRVKNTAPLKEQNAKERQNNLKRAFLVRKNDVKLKTILLIDDIYTTGSTVDEAAATLLESGAREVYVATLAGNVEG